MYPCCTPCHSPSLRQGTLDFDCNLVKKSKLHLKDAKFSSANISCLYKYNPTAMRICTNVVLHVHEQHTVRCTLHRILHLWMHMQPEKSFLTKNSPTYLSFKWPASQSQELKQRFQVVQWCNTKWWTLDVFHPVLPYWSLVPVEWSTRTMHQLRGKIHQLPDRWCS